MKLRSIEVPSYDDSKDTIDVGIHDSGTVLLAQHGELVALHRSNLDKLIQALQELKAI